ncbi:hypothetical protein LOK49_LG15G02342 [Camellia lanceoleosa]|uniref:Uncharacterized protein n=1 Tax=Camellia lanceoleosa TaxID=1840588 RepID=A0ACC0F728_9ERIC|nr:hypothetical protein LOK49_LG15G02342 [Camellia lanceoleosa]
MCTKYLQERKELVQALHKDIKLSDLPKITQPMLTIWVNQEQIFPLELGHRLKSLRLDSFSLNHVPFIFSAISVRTHTSDLKNVGHAINVEKSQEMFKHLKSFLVDSSS